MKELMFLALICLSGMTYAQTLEDHIGLTQDAVKSLLADVYSNDQGRRLNVPDFRQWEADYTREFEERLARYEAKLQQQVYMPLQEVVSRYESIANNHSLPKEQKKALMDSVIVQATSMKPYLQERFHKLLRELYFSHNLYPMDALVERKFKREGGWFGKKREIYVMTPIYFNEGKIPGLEKTYEYDANLWASHEFWSCLRKGACKVSSVGEYNHFKRFGFNSSHSRIVEGCETKACVVLKASALVFEIHAIKAMIDKGFAIQLPYFEKTFDMEISALNPFPMYGHSMDPFLELLSRTDYSDEVEAMPFELN